MKVLVTGGSGFVGSTLIATLAAQGFGVRATHRRANPPPVPGVEWHPLPSLDEERPLNQAVAGCDAVIHLAGLAHHPQLVAIDSPLLHRVNAEGTRLLARAAAQGGVRRFIFVSSIAAVCTRNDTPVDDSTPCSPTDAYGRSKLQAEHAVEAECAAHDTDWCVLRPPLVYGPGNPGNMRRLLQLIDTGLPLPFASIDNRRSFLFVDNFVDAMLCVLRHALAVRSTYVVSDGGDFSTPGLVRALAAASGRPARLFALPLWTLTALGRAGSALQALLGRSPGVDAAMVDRLVGSLSIDAGRFARVFGWQPPISPPQALARLGAGFRP